MKTRWMMLIVIGVAGIALSMPAVAWRDGARDPAVPRGPASSSTFGATRQEVPAREPVSIAEVHTSAGTAKAATDTTTLMGPAGLYPFRGDFETAAAKPYGDGQLTDGWTSVDLTAPENHWHVDTYGNPGTGNGAWCGSTIPPCHVGDPVGGYGNYWDDTLEFSRPVANTGLATDVRVQAVLRYDTEAGYDYLYLLRRTAAAPDFEPAPPAGQGLAWTGTGTATVDYIFHFAPGEYLDGRIRLAFRFQSDGAYSDGDCLFTGDGAAMVDDLVVTCSGGVAGTFSEDFEDGVIGPDWGLTMLPGVGDYTHVWRELCVDDPCHDNTSQQVAFIDTTPAFDPPLTPPFACGAIDGHGDFPANAIVSPAMPLPTGADGLTLAFDVYQDQPGAPIDDGPVYWAWSVRSAVAPASLSWGTWRDRGFYYFGPLSYRRVEFPVGDLLVAGATVVQVRLEMFQDVAWSPGPTDSPAPYFDNVRVTAYHDASPGPRWSVTESLLANDGFPASHTLNLSNLGSNSVRFDMAKNVAARSHQRNDPGDTICVDVVPRAGATLDTPVMHWTLARRNPLFDPYRTLPANPVAGVKARLIGQPIVANRWRFDLPDTGMLFPGDVLQYYFSATDHLAGDARTTTMPANLAGFGEPDPRLWPSLYTVRCLPTVTDATGQQPRLLLWNDQGSGAGDDEIYNALRLVRGDGDDFDLYTTRAPNSGLGNGLGGRAAVAQVAGYTDLLYTCGALSSPTLSNGDYAGDAGNDLALLNGWLALGGRDLLVAGDDLAVSLYNSGLAGQAFLQTTMGVQYQDTDVHDDIDGQWSPQVVTTASNPVFMTVADWPVHGHCPDRRDFDRVSALPGAVRLAQFTAPDGVATPYPWAAAALNVTGSNRVITLNHDLSAITSPFLPGSSLFGRRAQVLSDVVDYFGVPGNPFTPTAVPPAAVALAVSAQPNPFNPAVTLRYALPAPGRVTMKVFDARGALVRTLLDEEVKTTGGAVTWSGAADDGARVASGLYFVETRAGGQVDVRKVTMLK
jgi:hypothetical protein